MSDRTLFNVIIPTRERADTLHHCLRTIVAQDYDRLRIIVSDNCSEDTTQAVVDDFPDPRITYLRTPRRLSMSKNWEFALGAVASGWVTYLGDDDGLFPNALEKMDSLIRGHDVMAITSVASAFVWPGHFAHAPDGSIEIPVERRDRVYDAPSQLAACLSGRLDYRKLPWLYNGGTAKLDLINQCRRVDGTFFGSQIPDLYSAVALASVANRYLLTSQPFAMNGASLHSTGVSHVASTKSSTSAGPGHRFAQENDIEFHPCLRPGKSLQIILYECYLQSMHLAGKRKTTVLVEQLKIAVSVAPARIKASVVKQCAEIAELNGLSPDIRRRFSIRAYSQLLRHIDRLFCIFINPKKSNVATIYDAVAFAAQLKQRMSNDRLMAAKLLVKGIALRLLRKLA